MAGDNRVRWGSWACLLLLVLRPLPTEAGQVTWTLDPAQSYLEVEAVLQFGPSPAESVVATPQGPGSLRTSLSGSIASELDLGAPSPIFHVSSADLEASTSGPWEPDVGGAAGAAPAIVAGLFDLEPFGKAVFAVRTLDAIVLPQTFTLFGAGGLYAFTPDFSITADMGLDYSSIGVLDALFGSGSLAFTDDIRDNQTTSFATLNTSSETWILSMPFELSTTIYLDAGPTVALHYTAQFVATHQAIPEPGSYALLVTGAGALALVAAGQRRRGIKTAGP